MRCKYVIIALAAVFIGGCDGGGRGVRFTDGGAPASNKPKVEPIRAFSESEIRTALIGKTFQYTRADGNGFVTYNADGTMNFQDDTRGEGKGRWLYINGQYCETFGPTAAQECGEFKYTGDAYFASKSRLVEMKT